MKLHEKWTVSEMWILISKILGWLLLKIFQNWEFICYCFDKLRGVNDKLGMRPSQFFDLIGLAFSLRALAGQFDNSKQNKFF